MIPSTLGIIGCGNISSIYLKNLSAYEHINVKAVADIDMDKARARAAEFGMQALSVEALLADEDIDTILNLTIPDAHAEVSRRILEAGKSAYSEKPLATKLDDAKALVQLAESKGLGLGCAPDTFLGAGLQTSRQLIDEGHIGQPVAATAFMMGHGPEGWHPNPDFFYQPGAGPLFDMGPYYLTSLVFLLGPVKQVSSSAIIAQSERPVPGRETGITVTTPTHVAANLDFHSSAVATLITSFDVWASDLPRIEIYGTQGSLSVPDPNIFGGEVKLRRHDQKTWESIALTRPYQENSRGLGLAEMLSAKGQGQQARASGQLALHVVELMEKILKAAETSTYQTIQSQVARPELLPEGLAEGTVSL